MSNFKSNALDFLAAHLYLLQHGCELLQEKLNKPDKIYELQDDQEEPEDFVSVFFNYFSSWLDFHPAAARVEGKINGLINNFYRLVAFRIYKYIGLKSWGRIFSSLLMIVCELIRFTVISVIRISVTFWDIILCLKNKLAQIISSSGKFLAAHTIPVFLILSCLIIPILAYYSNNYPTQEESYDTLYNYAATLSELEGKKVINNSGVTTRQFYQLSDNIFELLATTELDENNNPTLHPYQYVKYKGLNVNGEQVKIYVSYESIAKFYTNSRNWTIEYHLRNFATGCRNALNKAGLHNKDYIVLVEGQERDDNYIYLILNESGIIYTIHNGMLG